MTTPVFPTKFSTAEFFLQRRLEEGHGGNIAIVHGTNKFTYEQVHRKACQVGNILRDLGVDIENRVLIIQKNTPEFVFSFFGVQYIGGVATFADPGIPTERQQLYPYFMNYTRAKVVIIPFTMVQFFAEIIDSSSRWHSEYAEHYVKAFLVTDIPNGQEDTLQQQFLPFDSLVSSSPEHLVAGYPHITKDDVSFWTFTSGTTDLPKACVHLQHDLPYATETYAKNILKYTTEDRASCLTLISGSMGLNYNILYPFAAGATAYITDVSSLNSDKIFDFIRDSKLTSLAMAPAHVKMLLQSERNEDLGTLKFMISAGDVLPWRAHEQIQDRFGVRLMDCMGCSEMAVAFIANNMEDDILPGSIGKVVPGFEVKIIGEDGKEVAANEIGELRVKGDCAAVGYWNQHEKTKRAFNNDWYTTDDMAYKTESGYYFLCGRKVDLLAFGWRKGGHKMSPARVEDNLLAIDMVDDCACVYIKHENPAFAAFVVLKEYLETEETHALQQIRKCMNEKIGENNSPSTYFFVDQIPRSAQGKIDRKALRRTSKL